MSVMVGMVVKVQKTRLACDERSMRHVRVITIVGLVGSAASYVGGRAGARYQRAVGGRRDLLPAIPAAEGPLYSGEQFVAALKWDICRGPESRNRNMRQVSGAER